MDRFMDCPPFTCGLYAPYWGLTSTDINQMPAMPFPKFAFYRQHGYQATIEGFHEIHLAHG